MEGDTRHISWPRRLLTAILPMRDGLWAFFFLVMVFTCGVIVALTFRVAQTDQRVGERALQQQLHSLEERVRVLEQREGGR
jgi:hypothetical protein